MEEEGGPVDSWTFGRKRCGAKGLTVHGPGTVVDSPGWTKATYTKEGRLRSVSRSKPATFL